MKPQFRLHRLWAGVCLCLALPAAWAEDVQVTPDGRVVYQGDQTRIGIGYHSDLKLRGEALHVFKEDAQSSFIGQGWFAKQAGGVQLSYHWWPGQDDAWVRKAFVAWDRNQHADNKLTLGGGAEHMDTFWGAYVSAGLSGRRLESETLSSSVNTVTGSDGGRPYEQDITTTVRDMLYARAYDYGLGLRLGHFYDPSLIRLSAGLDYEWGKASYSQTALNLNAEKFFEGTPHSLAVNLELGRKHGADEPDRNISRAMLMYRYAFGQSYRPERHYRVSQVTVPAPEVKPAPAPAAVAPASTEASANTPAPARVEKKIVKTTAVMKSDYLFKLDRATLTPKAKATLDEVIATLKANGASGAIRIVGHTCDLASDAYNLRLSLRRATAVKNYLVKQGGFDAKNLVVEGHGEREPRYPNTPAERFKNRRVELEFVTYKDDVQDVVIPAEAPAATPAAVAPVATPAPTQAAPTIEWHKELVNEEPAWARRALRNTLPHKETVDVYHQRVQQTTVTEGARRFLNRGPVAVNDTLAVPGNSAAVPVAVLANDSDPDGDSLSITGTTAAAHGSVSVQSGQVYYAPVAGYAGPDSFTYTITDGKGGSATATVNVTVSDVAPPPPANNRPPVAVDDRGFTFASHPLTMSVMNNDSDPDGDKISIVSVTQPKDGTVVIQGDAVVFQAKNALVNGLQSFTYTITDGKGGTATANVVVNVMDP